MGKREIKNRRAHNFKDHPLALLALERDKLTRGRETGIKKKKTRIQEGERGSTREPERPPPLLTRHLMLPYASRQFWGSPKSALKKKYVCPARPALHAFMKGESECKKGERQRLRCSSQSRPALSFRIFICAASLDRSLLFLYVYLFSSYATSSVATATAAHTAAPNTGAATASPDCWRHKKPAVSW